MEETGQVAPTGCPGGLDLTVGLGPVVRRLDRPEDPDRGRLGRTGRQTAEQERQPGVVATLVVDEERVLPHVGHVDDPHAREAVDDDTLAEGEGPLCNGFGEPYRAVLVPPTRAISRAALERLRESSAAGQEVAVLGPAPALVVTRTFRDARGPADVSWARSAPEEDPARVLPAGDVALDRPAPGIVVHHRRWAGAECYMILNELNEPARCTAHLAGALPARTWDARTGEVRDLPEATREGTAVRLPLRLAPWEARIVVLGAS